MIYALITMQVGTSNGMRVLAQAGLLLSFLFSHFRALIQKLYYTLDAVGLLAQ